MLECATHFLDGKDNPGQWRVEGCGETRSGTSKDESRVRSWIVETKAATQ